uniref:Neurotransmitter-gated ion-channel ligand-binding domain-containing protein n=1 Tax=Panagrolaimus sp. JU765 TaxID=591449 RepID=A0AC34RDF2_9BILA
MKISKALIVVILAFLVSLAQTAKKKKQTCKRTAFNRRTTNYQAWKEQMTICELLDGYDPAVRPFGTNLSSHSEKRGPVIVRTSLRIRSISAVSERNMEYVAQFRFQQEWVDDRLRFTHLSEFRNFEFINVAR